jgi:hypothetical protein
MPIIPEIRNHVAVEIRRERIFVVVTSSRADSATDDSNATSIRNDFRIANLEAPPKMEANTDREIPFTQSDVGTSTDILKFCGRREGRKTEKHFYNRRKHIAPKIEEIRVL